jgi:hypothetical protein
MSASDLPSDPSRAAPSVWAKARWALFLLPVLVLLWNSQTAYWRDIEDFDLWTQHMRRGYTGPPPTEPVFANTYLNTGCNYPPLGTIFSAGALIAIKGLKQASGWESLAVPQAFRGFLCLFEIAALALTFALCSKLLRRHVWLATFGLYLLPSSWSGGAIWGQIDVVNQVFLLWAAYAFVTVILEERLEAARSLVWIASGFVALVGSMLVKQLSLFSLPGMVGLFLMSLTAVAHRHGLAASVRAAVVSVALGTAFFFVLDRGVFTSPPGFTGISSYIWGVGSGHYRYLYVNGPNLWTFLNKENHYPSDVPFYHDVTPKEVGFTSSILLCAAMGLVYAAYFLAVLRSRSRFEVHRRELCLATFALMGLTNLVLGVFMTGTHERYFYHAFPFLFVGFTGLRLVLGEAVVWTGLIHQVLLSGFVSGCFVYSIIAEDAFRLFFFLRSQAFTASVLLVAVVILYVGFHRVLVHLIRSRDKTGHEAAKAEIGESEAAAEASHAPREPAGHAKRRRSARGGRSR